MNKFEEFLKIAEHLNSDLGIIPVLYGSLGLSKIINKDLNSEDIDILVPQKYITTNWNNLIKTFQKINYQLVDEKEHEFVNQDYKIGISYEEDLLPFANVDHKNLKILSENGAKYKVLDIEQYQKIYKKSRNDSYRSQKKQQKRS